MMCWALVFVVGWIAMTFYQVAVGSYPDAIAEIPVFIILFLWKAVWPFFIGSLARRHGGDFGAYFLGGIIIFFPVVLLFYWLRWSKKPVLLEYA